MSTLHKVKAYFGMAPMDDYDDEYYDDEDRGAHRGYSRRERFAAGLAFALRGSFDKVATKVFLLSPADVDVSPEERRRIAETGFYAYQ